MKVEDEDDEKQAEVDENVPDEAADSDMEDFDGLIGVDGEILDVKLEEMPDLEPDLPVTGSDDDEMVIEDHNEDELEPVDEPEKPPPRLPKVPVRHSIPCPTKSCMHRKENKTTGKSSR